MAGPRREPAYAIVEWRLVFTLAVGGNAMAVNGAANRFYVGGNMDRDITVVSLPGGRAKQAERDRDRRWRQGSAGDGRIVHLFRGVDSNRRVVARR